MSISSVNNSTRSSVSFPASASATPGSRLSMLNTATTQEETKEQEDELELTPHAATSQRGSVSSLSITAPTVYRTEYSPSASPSHTLLLSKTPQTSYLLANPARPISHIDLSSTYPVRRNSLSSSSLSSSSLAATSSSLTAIFAEMNTRTRIDKRMPTFQLEKFLRSHQHLSTSAERTGAAEILKKDARQRTGVEMDCIAKFLQTIEFFSHLSLSVCVDIAKICKLKKYNREEIIFREGDDATCFYVIMSGSVGTRMKPNIKQQAIDPQPSYVQQQQTETQQQQQQQQQGEQKQQDDLLQDVAPSGYIAGIEFAGSCLGVDSFSSSIIPRHSSTRLALDRTELLIVEMNEYDIIMRGLQKEQEKEKMKLLKQIKVMELCTPIELWRIAVHMIPSTITKNTIVFTQGDVADKIYFVASGECRAIYRNDKNYKKGHVTGSSTTTTTSTSGRNINEAEEEEESKEELSLDIGRLSCYAFFGELGLFTPNPVRTCTVYAETSVSLYWMSYDDFLARVPKFVLMAMKEWGETLYVEHEQLDRMMNQEQTWIKWKKQMIRRNRPQQKLTKEAQKSVKWEGRAQMHH